MMANDDEKNVDANKQQRAILCARTIKKKYREKEILTVDVSSSSSREREENDIFLKRKQNIPKMVLPVTITVQGCLSTRMDIYRNCFHRFNIFILKYMIQWFIAPLPEMIMYRDTLGTVHACGIKWQMKNMKIKMIIQQIHFI